MDRYHLWSLSHLEKNQRNHDKVIYSLIYVHHFSLSMISDTLTMSIYSWRYNISYLQFGWIFTSQIHGRMRDTHHLDAIVTANSHIPVLTQQCHFASKIFKCIIWKKFLYFSRNFNQVCHRTSMRQLVLCRTRLYTDKSVQHKWKNITYDSKSLLWTGHLSTDTKALPFKQLLL